MAYHDQPLTIYRVMRTIRAFEEATAKLFAAKELSGFVHLSVGQEACAVGVCSVLEDTDYIVSTHRGHGHAIAKGADLYRMMAELFGRREGYCQGRGGSMHIADIDKGILGANGIVGAGIPIAVGAAYRAQVKGTNQVAVAFFGDGAANSGSFHESLNLASVWNLPVIFVCENNLYAELTPQSVHTKVRDLAVRAQAYDMPGFVVDGNDVLAVQEAVLSAVKQARTGQGPTFLELKTYRWGGHYEGDALQYRPAGELEAWQTRDPILRYRAYLTAHGATSTELDAIDLEAAAQVAQAVEKSRQSPLAQ